MNENYLPPRRLLTSEIASYDVTLARFLQSKNAAILLKKICDWVEYLYKHDQITTDDRYGDGWIFLTIESVEEQCYISKKEQAPAFEILIKHGLIEKQVFGLPGKRYFRLHKENIEKLMAQIDKTHNFKKEITRSDKRELLEVTKGNKCELPKGTSAHYIEPLKEPPKEKEKKIKKEKIKFRDAVELTQDEYDKLFAEHGKEKLDLMLDKLNSYKASNGKKYDSDYHTMINGGWVRNKVEEEMQQGKSQAPSSSRELALQIQKEYVSPYAYIDITHKSFEIIPTAGANAQPIVIPFNENGFKDQVLNALQKKGFTKKTLSIKKEIQ